jgi:hypothetical protein
MVIELTIGMAPSRVILFFACARLMGNITTSICVYFQHAKTF